jgi:alkylhydroperoxidase/carboxymuconolactone decarboxylase family protein YurZ
MAVELVVRARGSAVAAHAGDVSWEGHMTESTPVLDTIIDLTAASLAHSSLPPRDLMLARMAALIAVDAPPVSYLANAPAAEEGGLGAEDIQGIMIAIAPVVGTARVASAAGKIFRALGMAIAVDESAMPPDAGEE